MKVQTILLVSVLFISSCTQTAYRWRNDDGNEITATWIAELDEPVVYDGSKNIRLRLQFDFGENIPNEKNDNDEQPSGEGLYYSLSTDGPWTLITDDINNAFVLSHSNYLVDGEPTTNQLPPVPNRAFGSGMVFTSAATDVIGFIEGEGGEFSEFEWSIKSTPNAEPNIYYFTYGVGYEISSGKSNNESPTIDDLGNELYIPQVNDFAMLIFSPNTIPLRNWSVAILVLLISGFLIYRFRKKHA